MFNWLKSDPKKKLQKEYAAKLEQAMLLQRSGKMAAFAEKTAEAEAIKEKMDQLRSATR